MFCFVSGTLDGDTEKNIDKLYVLLFAAIDENKSWYLKDNIKMYTEPSQVNPRDPDFIASNIMYCKISKSFSFVTSDKSNFCDPSSDFPLFKFVYLSL